MSYEVTATRRRPQRFDDLIGQEFVAATLKKSIQSGKIAHAYLFAGPRGCGKTSTARILAKALNCKEGPTDNPCGECTACQEITKGSSMDVIEIDGASNTSVNDIRQIKDEIQFPPNSLRYKIYIIDEVHMLSTSAFNALLKTIEEPPPYVVFIFATTELQKVPATIKSRCQQFNFRLVAVEQIKELLTQAATEINIQADEEALFWIARESTGSIRDAYTLFDQVAAFSDGVITYDKIRDKLGLVGIDRLNGIFEKCADGNVAETLELLDKFLQSGISIEQFIVNSADYLRSLLLLKNGIKKEALLGQSPERYNNKVIAAWNPVQIERALSIFLQLYRDIRYSLSPRYELELAFSRMCWLKQYVSASEVKKAIDAAHSLLVGTGNGSATVPPQEKPTVSGIPQFTVLGARHDTNIQKEPSSYPDEYDTPSDTDDYNPAPEEISESEIDSAPAESPGTQAPVQQNPGKSYPFAEGGALPPEQPAADQKTDTPTVNNRNISVDQLRSMMIADLSVTDALTASALIQTGAWHRDGNLITTTIQSAFQKAQLDRKAQELSDYLKKTSGEELSLSIQIKEVKQEDSPKVSVPPQVDIVCKVFRGSVVGGKI